MKKYVSERQLQAGTLLKDGDYESIRQMLGRIREYAPDRQVLAELDGNKNIVYYTSKDLYEEVMNLGDGLLDLGLGGAHIAIISENCCRYVIADICISSGVGVVTPIDANAPAALMGTLLGKCDATAAFCSSDCLGLLKEAKEFCPALETVITMDKKVEGLPYYGELVERGRELAPRSVYRNLTLDLDAPAKILFTSGTTGANKGVVLSNANLAANMMNCLDSIMVAGENTSMSVLPMHHATEINTHIMARIGCARLTYVNDNMRNMMANIKIFKPDVITVVPMIANAFYRNIWAGAKKAGKDEKLRKGIKLCNFLRKFGVDKTHELFPDVFAPFGGNLNMIVCGGSMLNPVVIKGMNDLGIHIENGYGITECGPLISINGDTLSEHLSVGRPCPGLEAKLVNVDSDGIGELCIRGKSVSQGYYKDPEATAAVFDKDGFFNTGDSAKIDSKGRILLMGRKKNTIVLSNGKNICPEEVENIIETNLDYAEDIVVYQASFKGREVLCAGLYISDEARRADRKALAADIAKVNAVLPSYKRIEYVELPASAYEKTSTRKIKRTQLPAECSGEGLIIS
ncbi:MAG: AMP-binding protein [Bacteroidales bacterium]|nr:AMP-binding protein [Bacteroidales bacterium]